MSRKKGDAVDPLGCYLRDVNGFPLLEPEEEKRLIRHVEEGRQAAAALAEPGVSPRRQRDLEERERRGQEARDPLVLGNLRLVVDLAQRYAQGRRFHGLELPDLIQEGNLGLLAAAGNVESGYGKFSTFATPWIRRTMRRAVADQRRIIRIPVRARTKLNRLRNEEHWYLAEKGRPPTREELAAELGVDTAELDLLRRAEADVHSLDQPVPDDDGIEASYGDVVEDPQGADFVQRTADRQWLDALLADLSERSRRILEWHYGHDLTMAEIGKREGVSRPRVRQIVREALEKLRQRST